MPGHGRDADAAQPPPWGQASDTELRAQTVRCAVWLEHIWLVGNESMRKISQFRLLVCLPLSHSSRVPSIQGRSAPGHQGYSQDVGDDADAPAKQRTGQSEPPGSGLSPARDSPARSSGEMVTCPSTAA